MRKIILILTITVFLSNCSNAQTNEQFLANELCNSFKEKDIEKSQVDLLKLVQLNSNSVYNNFPNKLKAISSDLEKNYSEKSKREIAILIGQKISLIAIENCPKFQKITQKIALPQPVKNKVSVAKVANELCALLNNDSEEEDKVLDNIIEENLFSLIHSNQKLIETEYSSFLGADYKNDLTAYLMGNCDIYYKLAMRKS